jgi:hypothetical protein
MLKEYSTDCTTFGLIVLSHIMTSATQHKNMLLFALGFDIPIPSGTFMYILESNDPYKYVVTMSINCIDRQLCTAKDTSL